MPNAPNTAVTFKLLWLLVGAGVTGDQAERDQVRSGARKNRRKRCVKTYFLRPPVFDQPFLINSATL